MPIAEVESVLMVEILVPLTVASVSSSSLFALGQLGSISGSNMCYGQNSAVLY